MIALISIENCYPISQKIINLDYIPKLVVNQVYKESQTLPPYNSHKIYLRIKFISSGCISLAAVVR